MLENIKMLLAIASEDTSKDTMINYWISYYTNMVKKYCHICGELEGDLVFIIEQVVVDKMGGQGSAGNTSSSTNGQVKSITRGDYSVTYFSSSESSTASSSAVLDDALGKYQSQLNLYRRLDY